jgi:potassium/hydrogen antiporter
VYILFDGGMSIGWSRFRSASGPIAMAGVLGTFLTLGGGALFAHVALGLDWYLALLIGTAVAATDPAVVFSVLSQREVSGLSGTILEGESGANDPVGIALMASLIAAGGLSLHSIVHAGGDFFLQMMIGGAIGMVGGRALVWFMRRVPLPGEELYPLRTLACALVLYAVTVLAHGSGFLAVFAAGIIVGDERVPYRREIKRFHSAVAGLSEIVVFLILGLTVDLSVLERADVWIPGVLLGLALAFVIRPILVGLCLLPAQLKRNERAFVLFAGLKGAVPILLGGYLLTAHVPQSRRLYGIVVVVVIFSVVVQGSLVPTVARLLHLPMRTVELEPWTLGVRLRDEPHGVHRLVVHPGAAVDGQTIDEVSGLLGDAWISFVVRGGNVIAVRGDTHLHAGDDVTVLANPGRAKELSGVFDVPSPPPPQVQ